MKIKRGTSNYFAVLGFILLVSALGLMFIYDVYPEHQRCEAMSDSLHSMVTVGAGVTGEVSATSASPAPQETVLLLIQRCDSVANDALIGYGLLSMGVAFLVGGIITMRETR